MDSVYSILPFSRTAFDAIMHSFKLPPVYLRALFKNAAQYAKFEDWEETRTCSTSLTLRRVGAQVTEAC